MDKLLNLTIGQLVGGATGILVFVSVFIEIIPVKLNPVSWILSWIGKRTNRELMNEVETMKNDINDMQKTIATMQEEEEERNAVNCRIRILGFSDEVAHKQRHSKESFDQVLSDIDVYERYCAEHPKFMNNKTVIAKKRIVEAFDHCLAENDFL